MQILYFAWVADRVGCREEEIAPPATVTTVGSLLDFLAGLSPAHAHALGDRAVIRVAVNHDFAAADHPVTAGDEIAVFPPVTGG
ncbi:MAG: molybdopterin converting factor subunit 1 [Alphaproteobacteria bacterium]